MCFTVRHMFNTSAEAAGCRSDAATSAFRDWTFQGEVALWRIFAHHLWKVIHLRRAGQGWGPEGTSKQPEGDLAPTQEHNWHCSTINPGLLYYFQIIFKWVKSLWGNKSLLNPPPSPPTPSSSSPQHFNGGHCYLVRVEMAQRLRGYS